MKVFWSWQSDLEEKTHRHFVKRCLADAIERLGKELDLEEASRPEIDHDTKGEAGMVDIPATILSKIAEAAVFVADVTPVAKTEKRALPNPNVMIELGFALQKPGPNRMIAVMNSAEGWKETDLPFDLRNRRVMPFTLAKGAEKTEFDRAQKRLTDELFSALKTNLSSQIEANTERRDIVSVKSKPNDRSVWDTAKTQIVHNDAFGRTIKETIAFQLEGTRAYARIVPASWTKGVPAVDEIANLPQNLCVYPPSETEVFGNFGACAEGFVRYTITAGTGNQKYETSNVCMYFDETGEFWTVHGTVVASAKEATFLSSKSLLRNWYRFLNTSSAALDFLGASKVRKVELGVVRISDVQWHSDNFGDPEPRARKPQYSFTKQVNTLTDNAILEITIAAYSGVKNLFALPAATEAEIQAILQNK